MQSILCDTACPTEANKVRQKWWTILARKGLEMVTGTSLNVIKCPLFKVHQAEKVRNLHPAWALLRFHPHKHALDGCSTQHTDPLGPNASRGGPFGSLRNALIKKQKQTLLGPPTEISGSIHVKTS